jgi:hypothetical protein
MQLSHMSAVVGSSHLIFLDKNQLLAAAWAGRRQNGCRLFQTSELNTFDINSNIQTTQWEQAMRNAAIASRPPTTAHPTPSMSSTPPKIGTAEGAKVYGHALRHLKKAPISAKAIVLSSAMMSTMVIAACSTTRSTSLSLSAAILASMLGIVRSAEACAAEQWQAASASSTLLAVSAVSSDRPS